MTDRSRLTTKRSRPNLAFRIAPAKPRNPLVAPAARRAAGPHRRSESAKRTADRQALKRSIVTKDDED